MRVFMFPGQSSLDASMVRRALGLGTRAAEVVGEASEILSEDLGRRFDATHSS